MTLSERTRTVSALGVIEIFAWGGTCYLMAVLAGPIAADTGWSAGLLSAGVSVGLLVSCLAATKVGRLIQATGGRRVLTADMSPSGVCSPESGSHGETTDQPRQGVGIAPLPPRPRLCETGPPGP